MKGYVFTLVYLLYAVNFERIDSAPTSSANACTFSSDCQQLKCPSGQVSRCENDKKCHCERYFVGCADAKHGDYAINPDNCHSFLRCISPVTVVQCPGGLTFDARTLVCVWSYQKPFCPRKSSDAPAPVAAVAPVPKANSAPAPVAKVAPIVQNPSGIAATGVGSSGTAASGVGTPDVASKLDTSTGVCGTNILCQNQGTCKEEPGTPNGWRCDCLSGFSGLFCENVCDAIPCNNGACVAAQKPSGFECVCNPGWEGDFCLERVNQVANFHQGTFHPVAVKPKQASKLVAPLQGICVFISCQNSGTCVVDAAVTEGFRCVCQPGFTGVVCQTVSNVCANVNCNNRGSCKAVAGKPVCTCNAGWEGATCATKTDVCKDFNCNNGFCQRTAGKPVCSCNAGWEGTTCATKTDVCKDFNCNNGFCQWTRGKPVCSCNDGWEGTTCNNKKAGPCDSVQCQNGAKCAVVSGSAFKCVCEPGFFGSLCEQGSAAKTINDACVTDATCQPLTGCGAAGQVAYCSVPGFHCRCKTNKVIACTDHATCSTGCASSYGLCMANGKCDCFADQPNYLASMHLNKFPNGPLYIQQ